DWTRSIRYAEEALKVDPSQADALFVLGGAYLATKDYKSAVGAFEKAVAAQPNNPSALVRLGATYAEGGEIGKAENQLEAAVRIDPRGGGEAMSVLSRIYLKQGKPDKAIQRVTQQIAQYPNQPALYEVLGQVYLDQKNYSKAEEAYRKLLSLDSN